MDCEVRLAAVLSGYVTLSDLATKTPATSGITHSCSVISQSNSELKQSNEDSALPSFFFLGQSLNSKKVLIVMASGKRHLVCQPPFLLTLLGTHPAVAATLFLFPQSPAYGIHITYVDGVPSAGHQGLWESLSGQSLGTQGILRCFPCTLDLSTSRCCFSIPLSCCYKISLLGVASPGMTTGLKPWSSGISPNSSGASVLSHLQGHQSVAYLLRVLWHFDCRFFSWQKLKYPLPGNEKLLRPHPSFSSIILNCQALTLGRQRKL